MRTWVLALFGMVLAGFASASARGAETPSPALLVLNKGDKQLAIIDPASGKVIARVNVGDGPHEVTVSSDGKFAYVGNYGQQIPGNTISVIDLPVQESYVGWISGLCGARMACSSWTAKSCLRPSRTA